jgi:hypothetical protein
MRATITRTKTIITKVDNEYLIMGGAYTTAGVVGHGTELLLGFAYLVSGVIATHLVHRRRARKLAEQQAAEQVTAE